MSTRALTAAIKDDHEEMYEYHEKYQQASGDVDTQERWARQLIWEVARHAVGEEIVVYPLMEKYLGAKGKELADHDRKEHQDVKQYLSDLESLTPGSSDYDALLEKTMKHLKPHNDDEENTDLPLLEEKLSAEESQEAADSFKRTKKFVPTRAHPSAPNQPPLETIVGFLTAPLDKLKDAFSKFPTDEMKNSS
ncbi:hypothetical protein SISNIDRAFT_414128 [Sistotremastrum niveocremeum HHB9708]|uniref:Hemerythrin-like domain-containing protein n=1 Tax=Sistotremastrum niveocremeum HHB9708 TaxID=1314777 RepID=A0A164SEV8_9AGAM|nr:hypothetical protein SISNIDRAFT_414128 [Sistotremastrum niveocremeum HHB9708]